MSNLPERIEIASTDSAEFHAGYQAGKQGDKGLCSYYGAEQRKAWIQGFRIGRQDAKNEGREQKP